MKGQLCKKKCLTKRNQHTHILSLNSLSLLSLSQLSLKHRLTLSLSNTDLLSDTFDLALRISFSIRFFQYSQELLGFLCQIHKIKPWSIW
ncbi:hypothetical protein HanXRQr2_Chr10g0441241 [Helianthus annuus]|uniref:Uncharacterized protein n=1 Tax=Helianthus annuus TaxID=4232 RepID=A0A251TJL9_HELAN|nr:hypothetical protein HanXRQr2_Chr10g0441241 [Helianthus annuus]KAJ0521839.1 hypothetical protein HanIR_Chr10g0475631 [Helianthus annuus]